MSSQAEETLEGDPHVRRNPSGSCAQQAEDSWSALDNITPTVLSVCFARDTSFLPNFKSKDRLTYYWKDIVVAMATAKRFAPQPCELIVFATHDPTDEVVPVLERIGAKIVKPPFTHEPPPGFYYAFNGAFYMFDAMDWCIAHRRTAQGYVFLDPDCVVTGDLTPIRELLATHDLIGYELPVPAHYRIGGMIPDEFRHMVEDFAGTKPAEGLKQYGGELLALSRNGLRWLTSVLPEVWEANLARFGAGQAKLNTEEQVISYLVWRDKPRVFDAGGRFVKRLWTNPRYRNIRRGDQALPVWHLPGEKSSGIPRIFRDLSRNALSLENMSELEFKKYAASIVGLNGAWIREGLFRLFSSIGHARMGMP